MSVSPSYDIELTRFMPAEAEAITGVSAVLQRDWRRHGYLPSQTGHARFDVFGLAKLLFLQLMTARGIGPAASIDYAEIAATAIARAALRAEGAMVGAPYPEGTIIDHHGPLGRGWGGAEAAPVLTIFSDGECWFGWDANHGIDQMRAEGKLERISGAMVIMDTKIVGELLAQRAGRPLVKVIEVPGAGE